MNISTYFVTIAISLLVGGIIVFFFQKKRENTKIKDIQNLILSSGQRSVDQTNRFPRKDSFDPILDEIRTLQEKNHELNQLLESLKMERERMQLQMEKAASDYMHRYEVQTEVQRSLGDIVSGLAHEINNPLTGIFGYIDLILIRNQVSQDIKDKLVHIQQQAMRIKEIIEKLNQLDPDSSHTKYEIDLVNLLDKMMKVMSNKYETRSIAFEKKFHTESLVVYGNHFSLWQAFDNILENSIEAIQENRIPNGKICIELKKTPENQYAVIDIIDNGGGFKNVGKAFDPFFTTKNRSQKKGIGLTIVFNIIKEHLGSILVSNNDEKGATVSIYLPLMSGIKNLNHHLPGGKEP